VHPFVSANQFIAEADPEKKMPLVAANAIMRLAKLTLVVSHDDMEYTFVKNSQGNQGALSFSRGCPFNKLFWRYSCPHCCPLSTYVQATNEHTWKVTGAQTGKSAFMTRGAKSSKSRRSLNLKSGITIDGV
jgi:hypothetical protein